MPQALRRTAQATRTGSSAARDFMHCVENAPLGIFIASSDGRLLYANPAMAALYGFPSPEELLRTVTDMATQLYVRPEDFSRLFQLLETSDAIHDFESRHRQRDGTIFWTSQSIHVVRDESGGIQQVHGFVTNNSHQKQTEEALQKSEERSRMLSDVTMEGILIHKNGIALDMNPALAAMLGYEREELLGADFMHFIHDDDRAIVLANIVKNYAAPYVVRMRRRDHTFFPVEIEARELRIGGDVRRVAAMRDITERLKAEKALRDSEERFSKAFTSSPAPLVISEIATGKFIDVNARWVDMLGYSREEQLGRNSKDVGIWIDPGERDRMVQKLRTHGSFKDEPIAFRAKSGKTVLALWSAEAITLGGQDVMLSFLYDETERRQAEELLRQSEERFAQLFRLSPNNITLADVETGVFLDVNDAFCRSTGYSREEAIGHTALELGLFVDERDFRFMADQAKRKGILENFEFESRVKGGTPSLCSLSTKVVRIKDKDYRITILNDITETKKMQEMMIQTEKMISLGGISAGIAHEINNPLGIIMQAAQTMVQRTRADFPKNLEVARDIGLDMDTLALYIKRRGLNTFIEDIQAAARRASEIIRHMLDFSRQSASERTFCRPGTLVEKALSLARNDYDLKKCYDFKKVQIDIDMEDALPGIFCVETEIEQVLLNLFRNAAQAMASAPHPVDSPRIAIRVGKHAGRVRIEVQDNGPGMPPAVQRRVFEPFFTTKPPGSGTGLGLSVSYFIITQGHGGSLSVSSTPGKGTTFIMELPTALGREEQT